MMSTQANATAQALSAAAVEAPLKRAPTLYAIIFFKLLKRPLVENVFARLRIHPENKFFLHIAEQIANVTETQVRVWAVGTMLFALFPLVEGIGLLYRSWWAGWLTIGESAFFVPIEIYELAKKYSPYLLVVMIANIFIVWYLYANRQTLFHHHHSHQES